MAFVSADKDILNWRVNHWLTGCTWGHSGLIYWGEDGELRTKEMVGTGYLDEYLVDLLREVDDFALLFIPLESDNHIEAQRRITKIETLPNKVQYDFSLQIEQEFLKWVESKISNIEQFEGNNHLHFKAYCSEYIYIVCHKLVSSFKTHIFADREIFEPDDVYRGSEILFEEHNND